jgi:SOS-response transcriptional repressor LexA
MTLSTRQREALVFIRAYTEAKGFAPTVREIQLHVGHRSPSSTHHMLTELRRRGCVTWQNQNARTLRTTG